MLPPPSPPPLAPPPPCAAGATEVERAVICSGPYAPINDNLCAWHELLWRRPAHPNTDDLIDCRAACDEDPICIGLLVEHVLQWNAATSALVDAYACDGLRSCVRRRGAVATAPAAAGDEGWREYEGGNTTDEDWEMPEVPSDSYHATGSAQTLLVSTPRPTSSVRKYVKVCAAVRKLARVLPAPH